MAGESRRAERTIGQSVMFSAPVIAAMFILGTSTVLKRWLGWHVTASDRFISNPVSRVGLTVQKAMGISTDGWGKGSMETKSAYTELLA